MSINAINSVSLYEYYYTINDSGKCKSSPLADEMKKYGLVPTDDEQRNIMLLEQAKMREKAKNQEQSKETVSYSERPWADIMYQLNISFNENPSDDIVDIKEKLDFLLNGIEDDELEQEINDLENYVERLYVDFEKTNNGSIRTTLLTSELNNLSLINRATML